VRPFLYAATMPRMLGNSFRVFALSDLHVDYDENFSWLEQLSDQDFQDDILIVAGDVSEELEKLESTFQLLKSKFAQVSFTPGNHDLWVRKNQTINSFEKLQELLKLCESLDIRTAPFKVTGSNKSVWVVPLYSWYVTAEQGNQSLYVPREGRDLTMAVWSDKKLIHWPDEKGLISDHLFELNEPFLKQQYDAPVISFSHFLPRPDLIFPTPEEIKKYNLKRPPKLLINFSRVAGSHQLEEQIRQLGSSIHVYGHQHRNRDRFLDNINYVSYGLGYPQERERGHVRMESLEPKLIWK